MTTILQIIELVAAVILVTLVLMQQQSAGLGSAFGGEGNVYRSRRGVEKLLFQATIVTAIVLSGALVASVVIS